MTAAASGGTRNRSAPLSRCRLLPRVDEGPGVWVDGGGELAEVECVGREGDAGGIVLRGEGQAGGGVLALEDESLAQDLVPPGIGSALEYWVDFEVGLCVGHRGVDLPAVLEQEEVPEEGCLVPAEPAFAVGGPDVLGVPDCFLGAVVEVVAEAGADLGLELDRDQELAVGDDEQVPLLLRPVVPRERERGTGADVCTRKASVDEDVSQEHFQGAHLGSAGDRAAGASVHPPALDLLLLLAVPLLPTPL